MRIQSFVVPLVVILLCVLSASASGGEGRSIAIPEYVRQLPSQTYRFYTTKPALSLWDVAGLSVGLSLVLVDEPVYDWVHRQPTSSGGAWAAVTHLGDPRLHAAGALILLAIGHHMGADLVSALGFTALHTLALKACSGMARPYLNEGPSFRGPSLSSDYAAFPSAHTASSFALATVVHQHHEQYGPLAYGLAAAAGWSRIRLKQHWPSNVAVGAMIGYLSARHGKEGL